MNEIINLIKKRKSTRVFLDKAISPAIKQEIIHSAFMAPTAGNMMLYSIIDVTDQTIKDTLAKTCDNQPFIKNAPLVLVFLADYSKWYNKFSTALNCNSIRKPALGDFYLAISDALIAAQNTVVAAESFGIGSCYIGDIVEQANVHIDLFDLPKHTIPVGMLVFGYPTDGQINREKPKRFDKKYIVFENKYNNNMDTNFTTNEEAIKLYNRKYISDFMEEMNLSTKILLEHFLDENLTNIK